MTREAERKHQQAVVPALMPNHMLEVHHRVVVVVHLLRTQLKLLRDPTSYQCSTLSQPDAAVGEMKGDRPAIIAWLRIKKFEGDNAKQVVKHPALAIPRV